MQTCESYSFKLKIILTAVDRSKTPARRYYTSLAAHHDSTPCTYFAFCGPLESEELALRIQTIRNATARRVKKLRWRLDYEDEFSIRVTASLRMLDDFGFRSSEDVDLSALINTILKPRKKLTPIGV
jgi:hypothetical protein